MDLTFLEATLPLTKTYSKAANGDVKKTPYPMTWEFTSHKTSVANLVELHAALNRHAVQGHCLLKGNVQRPLVNESRAGSTDSNAVTEFIVLDLDGLPETHQGGQVTLDSFLVTLGLGDTSHVVQWSASYGIENQKLRAHVFFMLDKPAAAPLLKQWLIQLNHEVGMLNASMGLTKTGNAISWALDISA